MLRKAMFLVAVVALTALATGCCFPCDNSFGNPCAHPSIDVEKYIAYSCLEHPPTVFEDADSAPGIKVPMDKHVYYQMIVTNTGDVKLTNVELNDEDLFGVIIIGDLLPGVSVTVEPDPIPAVEGGNTNVATVTGYNGFTMVQDSDAASYYTY
jgi:hypothetical protein